MTDNKTDEKDEKLTQEVVVIVGHGRVTWTPALQIISWVPAGARKSTHDIPLAPSMNNLPGVLRRTGQLLQHTDWKKLVK